MAARAEPGTVSTSPCSINPGAGYRRLENQLYRIEVHQGGSRAAATFKWSRDNGSIISWRESQSGDDITVGSAGRDYLQRFASGMLIELTDDEHELRGAPGTLVRILTVNDRVLTIDPLTADGPVDITSFGNQLSNDAIGKEGTHITMEDKKVPPDVFTTFALGKYTVKNKKLIRKQNFIQPSFDKLKDHPLETIVRSAEGLSDVKVKASNKKNVPRRNRLKPIKSSRLIDISFFPVRS